MALIELGPPYKGVSRFHRDAQMARICPDSGVQINSNDIDSATGFIFGHPKWPLRLRHPRRTYPVHVIALHSR
jgi:hypothetical protein